MSDQTAGTLRGMSADMLAVELIAAHGLARAVVLTHEVASAVRAAASAHQEELRVALGGSPPLDEAEQSASKPRRRSRTPTSGTPLSAEALVVHVRDELASEPATLLALARRTGATKAACEVALKALGATLGASRKYTLTAQKA